MLLILGIISTLFTAILFVIYRDIRIPPVLLGIEFSIIFLLEFFIGYKIYAEDLLYGFFLLGVLSFFLGYYFFGRMKLIRIKSANKSYKTFCFNLKLLNFILIIADIYFCIEIWKMYIFSQSHFVENYFTTIHRLYSPTPLFGRIRLCAISLSVISAIIYFMFNKGVKAKYTFFHSAIISILYSIATTGRSQVVLPLISIITVWLYSEKQMDYKKMIKLSIMGGIFVVFFLYTATLKYTHLLDDLPTFFLEQIRVYLCSSMPAFIHWVKQPKDLLLGQNTFRFFYALMGVERNTITIAQDFIKIDDLQTNVYTIYQYYANDFGLLFALIVQFFIGGMYNILYRYGKQSRKRDRNYFVYFGLYSLLFYALAMQYGGDSYMALLSTWIQLGFWLWFFSRKWIIREKNNG